MTLFIATSNPHKLREIRGLLSGVPVEVYALGDLAPIPEPEETGATFEDNALVKALYYDRARAQAAAFSRSSAPVITIAEDSGLVIDALDGEPGARSARFLRPDATYPERFEEIYRRLATTPTLPRTARFVCALVAVQQGVPVFTTTGVIEGEIAPAPGGTAGFGYDPIFWYPPYGCTLAEVDEESKLRVAHRGQAFRALVDWLRINTAHTRTGS